MSRILGLDLGTNSIGWAVVDEVDNEFELIDKGVRIFSEGVKSEKGIESSRAAERTGFRSARKIKFRRKLRKYETLRVLSRNDMCPLSIEEIEAWRKSGFKVYPLNPEFLQWLRTNDDEKINPYFFRDKASKQKVLLFELGRALYHIAQRRGFLSNRLDQSAEGIFEEHCPNIEERIADVETVESLKAGIKDYFENVDILDESIKGGFKKDLDEGEKKLKSLYNSLRAIITKNENDFEKAKQELIARLNRKEDLGPVKKEIHEITQKMQDGKFNTLGQYFFSLYNKGKIRNHYTAREAHYLSEFEIICETQGIEGINKNEVLPEKRYTGLAKELYKAIFFQRPLKSQKGLIGKCSFEKSKSRSSVSHPDFEEYRMWAFINTIKIKTPADETLRFLSKEEKESLIPKFIRTKENFDFEDLAKVLIEKGATFEFYKSSRAKAAHYLFNYKAKDTVSGCPVSASLKNVLGEDWKTRKFSYQTKDAKGKEATRSVDYLDLWHLLSVSTSDIYLEEYAKNKLGLDSKEAKSFSKIRLKKDYSSLSLNAINKILPYLKEGLLYSHAVFMANIGNIVDAEIWNDKAQRELIQNRIAEIIESHSYENGLLEAVNGLIKDCKKDGSYYSKEAEPTYKKDLREKLGNFYKYHKIPETERETVLNDLFPVFIEQLKNQEFKAIKRLDEKVLEFLKGQNDDGQIFCSDAKQLKKLYHPSDIDVFKKKIIKDENGNEKLVLGSPLTPSIRNPMAMRALHQLRKVLNALILDGQIDAKTRVHIELARELNDANKRKGIQDFQNENKKDRQRYREEIKKLYFEERKIEIEPTEDDLLRYQLWIEQERKEIYEEGRSIRISEIIGANPNYDIEHTIPRSISQDNSLMNKTLCSQQFNRDVKKNSMPCELQNHQDILLRVAHWKTAADILTKEIEGILRATKTAATKEAKDKKIRKRHYLTLKRNYLEGKYDRFIMTEPKVGFKNSQIPDTGIITKYSRAYLKSYFDRVESVKGGMVAEFRKIWGIQESFQENGKKYFAEKDRSKHTHHTIDAITIACMTKDKYNVLAHAWALEDKEHLNEARKLLADSKPWKTFKEDLKKIEEEILVSHHTPDNVKKQSKKIMRVRGKKQYVAEMEAGPNGKAIPKKDSLGKTIHKLDEKGNKIPRLHQGDTVRGSLHQDSIYGAIKDPLNQESIRYVIRKDLESIKASDVENIVDEAVKEKVKEAIRDKILIISSNPQQKNKFADNKKVWMNEEKGIAINKVRLYANSVKNPLEIKEHSELSKSRHEHKQAVYAQNDENYCMAIYDDGKSKDFELINIFNLSKLRKQGQGIYSLFKEKLIKGKIIQMPIAKSNHRDLILKRGQQVIFYDKSVENPKDITEINDLTGRVYLIEGLSIQRIVRPSGKIDEYGVIMFRYNKEARKSDDIKIDNFKPDGIFKLGENKPTRKMNHNQFTAFVEGIDFKVLPTGKMEKI